MTLLVSPLLTLWDTSFKREVSDMELRMLYVLNSVTNYGLPNTAKWPFRWPFVSRRPLKDHLADFICPGFGVEFITFNISGDDSMLLISLLQGAGAPHIISYVRWSDFHSNFKYSWCLATTGDILMGNLLIRLGSLATMNCGSIWSPNSILFNQLVEYGHYWAYTENCWDFS